MNRLTLTYSMCYIECEVKFLSAAHMLTSAQLAAFRNREPELSSDPLSDNKPVKKFPLQALLKNLID